jgi:hypothetical protein
MKKITLLLLLFVSNVFIAQEKMITDKGVIKFEASVPFFEEVKAKNDKVMCTLTTKANDFSCIALIKNFHFKIGLMEEHFNRNYMESNHYPKAIFKGKIEKFDLKDINALAKEYQIKGKLVIHGKSKKIIVLAKIRKVATGIELISNFTVNTDDYGIEIPLMVRSKISQNASIQLEFVLQ